MGSIVKKIISESELTVFTALGNISGQDVIRVIWDFYERGPVTRNVLWDLSHAELESVSSEDAVQITHVPRKFVELRTGGKTAILAPNDLAYGLSRAFQTSSQPKEFPFELEVFRDKESAYTWLEAK